MCCVVCLLQEIMLEKFASRHPSCVSYDDKMQFYSQVADEVRRLQGVRVYIYVRTQQQEKRHLRPCLNSGCILF